MEHSPVDESNTAPQDRTDLPRSFLNTVWPLLALALMSLVLLRACLPIKTTPAIPQQFDVAAATQRANDGARRSLEALSQPPTREALLDALNRMAWNFDKGSAEVPEQARPLLQAAAAAIAKLPPEQRIEIVGHTDNIGAPDANAALSAQRAQAVRDALVAAGVRAEQLQARGAGDLQPVATNDTEEGRFRNRRIEFRAP